MIDGNSTPRLQLRRIVISIFLRSIVDLRVIDAYRASHPFVRKLPDGTEGSIESRVNAIDTAELVCSKPADSSLQIVRYAN